MKKAPEEAANLDFAKKSPRLSYLGSAIPRAVRQGVSARAKTCLNIPIEARWKEAFAHKGYCVTQGVFSENETLVDEIITTHLESGNIEEGGLTPEMMLAYNRHYWEQLLSKKNVPLPILRVDDPLQVFYPSNQGLLPLELGSVNTVDYLVSQASNWPLVEEDLNLHRPVLDEALEKGSMAYMMNHSSWPNIPFLVAAMHRVYGIPLERFHVLLGPALTTFEQGLELARIANIIKTIPSTPNGQLPEDLKDLEKQITGLSTRKIREVLTETGNILLYCPFGTTDKKDKETGELVLDATDEKILKFQRVINAMAPVVPVGTYDLEAFNGAKILTPGRVNLGFGEKRERRSIKTEKDQVDIAQELARNIVDYEGSSVGRLRLPTVEIIGSQGKFGAALTHVLKAHSVDKCFDVLGVTRKEAEAQEARDRPEIIVVTAPSWAKESILNYIRKNPNSTLVLTAKGPDAIDLYHQLTLSEQRRVIILSGPNKADQIENNEPSAAVIAGTDPDQLERVHSLLNGPNLRLYQSESPNVIQMSGVLKNLIVLELGKVWDKLADHPQQKTDLLIQALGAAYSVVKTQAPENENPEEFWGIAGLGDILLCLEFFEDAKGSRNFTYGKQIAQGHKTSQEIERGLGTVEGIGTSLQFHSEESWLQTDEINQFRNTLKSISEGHIPPATPYKESPTETMFSAIFAKLESICREKGFTENTRAWAFCRIHREMQIAFPDVHKKDILHAMCQAIIRDSKLPEQGNLDLSHFAEIEGKNTRILQAFSDLETTPVDEIMKQVLGGKTKTEGFKKD